MQWATGMEADVIAVIKMVLGKLVATFAIFTSIKYEY